MIAAWSKAAGGRRSTGCHAVSGGTAGSTSLGTSPRYEVASCHSFGTRPGSLSVPSCSRCASSRTSTLTARWRRIDCSSVSPGSRYPPGSDQAPRNGSRARCQSRTCSRPSRIWKTTARETWVGLVNFGTGFSLSVENLADENEMAVAEAQLPIAGKRDVEEILREGGLSRFHRKAVLVTGAAWTFVAMEILLVGFVQAIFLAKWNLNGTWQGLINSSALAGSLCGSLVLGRLADRIGRRTIFQYAILWYAIFTALTALAWGPWSVMTLRFLAGVGLGGMLVVDPSMLAEYLPPQRRGRLLVFLDFWWPVGLLLATGLSW